MDFPNCVIGNQRELDAEELVKFHLNSKIFEKKFNGRNYLGKWRLLHVQMAKRVLLYQSAENFEQTNQIQAIQSDGKRL